MRLLDAAAVDAALAYDRLIDRLAEAFREGCRAPLRHHHEVEVPGRAEAGTLLLMPAWQPGRQMGVKLVGVFPGNQEAGLPSVQGVYVLFDAATGTPQAVLDGQSLTVRRTAAASALAARFLAREDSETLLMVGAGALAPHLIAAHGTVRSFRRVRIWNRAPDRARRLASELAERGLAAEAVSDLAASVRDADVASCAPMAREPLIRGEWLRPGTHLDLVGGFTPAMREADDEAVRRARVFVDTRTGAFSEAGDIVTPLRTGVLREDEVAGELAELCRGDIGGRRSADEITFFKSVGASLEDLAAAALVYERSAEAPGSGVS
jgi:alanine dehydrogenase